MELGVAVFGHWGPPLLGFPTSAGDEWELEGQSMVGALADFIDAGRIKFFHREFDQWGKVFTTRARHPISTAATSRPFFDSYLREEVVPFIWNNCQSQGIAISTMGASFGAYHAANSLFKHPDVIKRCFAMSGVYDVRNFMDGMYDDNFYFNNPVDYLSNAQRSVVSINKSPVATFTSARVRVPGRIAGPPTASLKFSPARGSATRSTTGEPQGGPRLAVLEAPDARVRLAAFLSPIFGGT